MEPFVFFKQDSSLGEFFSWAKKVADEGTEEGDILTKLLCSRDYYPTSIKVHEGCSNLISLQIEYCDGTDDSLAETEICITPEDAEDSAGTYEEFCKSIYLGMHVSCMDSEDVSKIFK